MSVIFRSSQRTVKEEYLREAIKKASFFYTLSKRDWERGPKPPFPERMADARRPLEKVAFYGTHNRQTL